MKYRLKNALALLECQTLDQLITQFLTFSFQRSHFSAVIVSIRDQRENRLQSWTIDAGNGNKVKQYHLDADIDDINHPLVQILYRGTKVLWPNLNQGSHIDNEAFRQFIEKLPSNSGLYGTPLFDHRGDVCGAITLLGLNLDQNTPEQGIFPIYCSLFCHRLNKLMELEQLKQQMAQLQYLLNVQKEKEAKLDKVIASLSAPALAQTVSPLSDFSSINDLTAAAEQYEKTVIRHRQKQTADNLDETASSLNLSKRSLIYKLKKYGCL
nr:Fis family transcriptional regulator [uncultured Moellerella sp.]